MKRYGPLWLVAPALVLLVLPFVASLSAVVGYSLTDAGAFTTGHWSAFVQDGFGWKVLARTIRLGALVTAITLLVAYPTAAAMCALRHPLVLGVSYVVIFAPLLISVIVRTYGWFLLLSDGGIVNATLAALGLGPYRLIYNETGAVIALVHVLLPFAVFPLLSVMKQIPDQLGEAARDLGARRHQVLLRVSLPLTLPAILAAGELVFAMAVSSFVTPTVLGGGRVTVLAKLISDNIGNLQWGLASVQSLVLLAIVVLILGAFRSAVFLARRGAA